MSRSNRLARIAMAFAACVAIVIACVAGCGEDNYVVGGKCATGYTQCGVACVDLQSDPTNCGSCGNVCPSSTACSAGVCGGARDATVDGHDGSDGGDDSSDGSPFDGIVEEGGHRDGGDGSTEAGDGGDGGDGAVCTPPFNTPQHCGDCNTVCAPPNDQCKPSDGGFACAPFCNPPLSNCHGVCVDLRSDPFNCGVCDHVCPTFLCQSSQCVTGFSGELVLIGHDFATNLPNPGSQVTVLTNSVFVRPSNPLRVLAYERYALAAAVTRVTSILQTFATQNARTLTLTHTSTDSDIPTKLDVSNFDVLLVYDQATAPAGALGSLGTSWATTLATFTAAGGLVVVLDGGGGATLDGGVSEMPQLVTNGGLLNVTSQTTLPSGTRVKNIAPGDSVGRNVGTQYGTTNDSVFLVTDPPSSTLTYVIYDQADMQPVVVHKTF